MTDAAPAPLARPSIASRLGNIVFALPAFTKAMLLVLLALYGAGALHKGAIDYIVRSSPPIKASLTCLAKLLMPMCNIRASYRV